MTEFRSLDPEVLTARRSPLDELTCATSSPLSPSSGDPPFPLLGGSPLSAAPASGCFTVDRGESSQTPDKIWLVNRLTLSGS